MTKRRGSHEAAPSLCLRLYSGLAEVLPEEGDDLFPAVGRGFLVVAGPIYCEESVAGSGVHVKLVVLVQTFELRLSLGDVGWRGAAVFLAEQSEEWAI